jgi:hypothetical protein
MRTAIAALLAAAVMATSVPRGTAQALDATSRAVLGAEIRRLLSAEPEIVARALAAPPVVASPYRDAIARDLDTIGALSARLFSPDRPGFGPRGARAVIALFTRADCARCARAEAELRALAEEIGVRATLFDIDADADLATRLELDVAPSYVMADRMLRGHMPTVVLDRYLRAARGN